MRYSIATRRNQELRNLLNKHKKTDIKIVANLKNDIFGYFTTSEGTTAYSVSKDFIIIEAVITKDNIYSYIDFLSKEDIKNYQPVFDEIREDFRFVHGDIKMESGVIPDDHLMKSSNCYHQKIKGLNMQNIHEKFKVKEFRKLFLSTKRLKSKAWLFNKEIVKRYGERFSLYEFILGELKATDIAPYAELKAQAIRDYELTKPFVLGALKVAVATAIAKEVMKEIEDALFYGREE